MTWFFKKDGRIVLDSHGQPADFILNSERIDTRNVSELIGICKGTIADGVVHPEEAKLLRSWLTARPELYEQWPCGVLADRIEQIFADGQLHAEELEELRDLLARLVGTPTNSAPATDGATRLPVDMPLPPITFSGSSFSITGRFAFGSRAAVIEAITVRGGAIHPNPKLKTDFLVIGTFASRDWIATDHGRKIERAIEIRESPKGRIKIVGEEHWVDAMRDQ